MSKTWNSVGLLAGEAFLFAASGAVVVIVLSRWGGAELLGQYSLVLAWIALFQAIANFGLMELTLRELGRAPDPDGKLITHGLLIGVCTSSLCMLAMAGLVFLVDYPENVRMALLLGVLLLAPMTLSSICRAAFLAHERPHFVFGLAAIESLTALGINCYLAISGYGILALVVTTLGVKVVTALLSLRLLKTVVTRLRPAFDRQFLRNMFSTLLTFGIGGIVGTVSTRISLILLSFWATLPTVGLYAASSKVMELALILPAIFAQALLPRLSRSFAQNNAAEAKATLLASVPWLLGTVTVLAGGVAVSAPWLLKTLFGAEFVAGAMILRLLMIFLIVESIDTMMSVTLKAAGKEKLDVRLFVGNVAVNIGASMLLIPGWGGIGCAIAKLLGGATSSIPRALAISRLATGFEWAWIRATRNRIRSLWHRADGQ